MVPFTFRLPTPTNGLVDSQCLTIRNQVTTAIVYGPIDLTTDLHAVMLDPALVYEAEVQNKASGVPDGAACFQVFLGSDPRWQDPTIVEAIDDHSCSSGIKPDFTLTLTDCVLSVDDGTNPVYYVPMCEVCEIIDEPDCVVLVRENGKSRIVLTDNSMFLAGLTIPLLTACLCAVGSGGTTTPFECVKPPAIVIPVGAVAQSIGDCFVVDDGSCWLMYSITGSDIKINSDFSVQIARPDGEADIQINAGVFGSLNEATMAFCSDAVAGCDLALIEEKLCGMLDKLCDIRDEFVCELTARDDKEETIFDTPVTFSICDNDVGDMIQVTSVDGIPILPTQGVNITGGHLVQLDADGCTITFTPAVGTIGQVLFPYEITDDVGDTATATICITIAALMGFCSPDGDQLCSPDGDQLVGPP